MCKASTKDAFSCLRAIPFNITLAEATLEVLSESLENFGFLALYHNTGPPYQIKLDIMDALSTTASMVKENYFASDFDFQEHVQQIFTATLDAHTRYRKPACYNVNFVQPISFSLELASNSNEPVAFVDRSVYAEDWALLFPDIDLERLYGQPILLVNGIEFTTEIADWRTAHETRSNDAGARFNFALRFAL